MLSGSEIRSRVRSLCTPAHVYLMMSVLFLILLMLQNAGNSVEYCAGSFGCEVSSTAIVLLAHGAYIVFWTFVLNALCKAGYKSISWFLLLLPFLMGFVLIGLFIMSQGGMCIGE